LLPVANFASLTGKGVSGAMQGTQVAAGNAALMHDLGASSQAMEQQAEALRKAGQTVMFVAWDGRLAGLVAVADPIRESTPQAIKELKRDGIKVVMVTGDNRTTAAALAQKLGIEFEAEVLPAAKSRGRQEECSCRERWWPWPAMGSTMRLRWRKRRLASRWVQERMWRWSLADHPGEGGSARHSQGAAFEPADHAQHPSESFLLPFSTTPWVCLLPRVCSIRYSGCCSIQ